MKKIFFLVLCAYVTDHVALAAGFVKDENKKNRKTFIDQDNVSINQDNVSINQDNDLNNAFFDDDSVENEPATNQNILEGLSGPVNNYNYPSAVQSQLQNNNYDYPDATQSQLQRAKNPRQDLQRRVNENYPSAPTESQIYGRSGNYNRIPVIGYPHVDKKPEMMYLEMNLKSPYSPEYSRTNPEFKRYSPQTPENVESIQEKKRRPEYDSFDKNLAILERIEKKLKPLIENLMKNLKDSASKMDTFTTKDKENFLKVLFNGQNTLGEGMTLYIKGTSEKSMLDDPYVQYMIEERYGKMDKAIKSIVENADDAEEAYEQCNIKIEKELNRQKKYLRDSLQKHNKMPQWLPNRIAGVGNKAYDGVEYIKKENNKLKEQEKEELNRFDNRKKFLEEEREYVDLQYVEQKAEIEKKYKEAMLKLEENTKKLLEENEKIYANMMLNKPKPSIFARWLGILSPFNIELTPDEQNDMFNIS